VIGVALAILPGAGAAEGDAVDEFEVAGIEAERELDFFYRRRWSIRRCGRDDI